MYLKIAPLLTEVETVVEQNESIVDEGGFRVSEGVISRVLFSS